MNVRTFAICLAVAALGFAAMIHSTAHLAALPMSSPFGAYDTRAEAMDAASHSLDQGTTCLKVEAVNDTATELQPC